MNSNELIKDDELREGVERAAVISKAKPFMKEVKGLLDKIEADLYSEDSNTQMNGTVHAMALNECLKQYSPHLEEIIKTFEEENKTKVGRANDDGK